MTDVKTKVQMRPAARQTAKFPPLVSPFNLGVGKSRFTVVCMEKGMQVITVALSTQKNTLMQL